MPFLINVFLFECSLKLLFKKNTKRDLYSFSHTDRTTKDDSLTQESRHCSFDRRTPLVNENFAINQQYTKISLQTKKKNEKKNSTKRKTIHKDLAKAL